MKYYIKHQPPPPSLYYDKERGGGREKAHAFIRKRDSHSKRVSNYKTPYKKEKRNRGGRIYGKAVPPRHHDTKGAKKKDITTRKR